jgi:hypothetical protein
MSGAPSEPSSPSYLGTCLYGYADAAGDLIAANDGSGLGPVGDAHSSVGSCWTPWRAWEVTCWSATS